MTRLLPLRVSSFLLASASLWTVGCAWMPGSDAPSADGRTASEATDAAAATVAPPPAVVETEATLEPKPAAAEPAPAAQEAAASQGDEVSQEAEERWRIRMQQMRMEAEDAFQEGQRLLAKGDFDGAIAQFERVLDHIRWAPVQVDWGSLEERARDALAEARRAKEMREAELRRLRDREAFEKIRAEEELARERQRALVDRLLSDAIAAFERNDFAEAERIAQGVLEKEPGNDRARKLLHAAREAARDAFNRRAIDLRKEEFRRWKQEIEETRIPYADILVPPDADFWRKISEKRTVEKTLALESVRSPADEALLAKLESTRVASIQFPDTTVPEAAGFISTLTGIPIVVDPEVAADLDASGVLLNISTLTDISVKSLLNIITSQAGEDLTYVTRHGVVLITRKEKALGDAVPRIHSVQDLTFALTDFRGPKIGSIPKPGAEFDEEEGGPFGSDQVGENVVQPEEIVNLIRENIARDTWDTGNFSIDTANNNQILVIHTPEVQLQVAQFLDDLRRFSSSVVTIESRFVTITDAFLEEIGTDFRGLGGSSPGDEIPLNDVTYGLEDNAGLALDNNGPGLSTGTGLNPLAGAFFNDGSDGDIRAFTQNFFESALGSTLSTTGGAALQIAVFKGDSAYNMVVRAIEKSLNATEISAPIVTVFNTERAYVTVTNQVSFVQDFDVDVANSAFIANPNIGIIQEGVVLDVRPTISYDRKYITLEIQATVANLVRPIRQFTTSLAGFSVPVSFQLPELEVQSANTTVRVPDGGSLILGGLKKLHYVNRTAEVPWLGRIPVLGALFRQKGLSDEAQHLIVLVRASITDLAPWRND